ncbi:carboxymuconolactone decarboxylase family protein [Tomitella cavernea]|uniref:Carboxymuconolactone decarboxylase family protein n=2 Tax=Tomitella cavernea TaxID=1387982 RepID=A0ABP9CRU5_9ACTN
MPATQRMAISEVDGGAYKAVLGLQKYVNEGVVDALLRAIVDIRASQINHCAWCLDMHVAEARDAGAPQRQIDLIAAWREAPALFDDRERAALALTEQVTLISRQGVSDEVWAQVRAVFTEQETLELLMTIATINVWNRMNVAVRADLPTQPTVAG